MADNENQRIMGENGNNMDSNNTNSRIPKLNPKDFKDGLDLEKMYKQIYLASEGYLWQMSQTGNADLDKVVKDYKEMVDFWRVLFLK